MTATTKQYLIGTAVGSLAAVGPYQFKGWWVLLWVLIVPLIGAIISTIVSPE